MAHDVLCAVKDIIAKEDAAFAPCVTSDCWQAKDGRRFHGGTLHFISNSFKLRQLVLGIHRIKSKKDTRRLLKSLRDFAKEFGLPRDHNPVIAAQVLEREEQELKRQNEEGAPIVFVDSDEETTEIKDDGTKPYFSMTTDNGGADNTSGDQGSYVPVKCIAHTLNLIVKALNETQVHTK